MSIHTKPEKLLVTLRNTIQLGLITETDLTISQVHYGDCLTILKSATETVLPFLGTLYSDIFILNNCFRVKGGQTKFFGPVDSAQEGVIFHNKTFHLSDRVPLKVDYQVKSYLDIYGVKTR